ncbi:MULTISPECIES: type II secretion system minor pseudopilin GspK [Stenotrophomonas]|uniref:Type II secretion system protein K n=1 Tax=Stenotrophomonas maltophilia TaxID=40324 RepID=A0AAD0BUQ2_STEMA|nr:type II secretion system minor pseudopilin GspK [Stenotrophomonas maltophilia]AUI09766.1 general secretion pathway protein GspK [Stenotrophomonas maltophilia]MBA2128252.1 general secretion pathway protein GspK [Stenotrophomonas maltophilia]MBH1682718.1 type II secretion system minor pseudopilin GspK [Stenotrophomonas maltophilia]MBH1874018.1 type II secretion system minor pseudopilin GspK [Stenotrophomonas maltophilia]
MTARTRSVPCARQRGMAVIVALLVVALVAVIATALLTRQSAQLRALHSDQLRAQVRMAVDATLERAAQQLRDDVKEQLTTVRSGRWTRPLTLQAPLPVQLQLVDAQSMFNLRNLLAHGRPDPEARRAFIALCAAQGLGQGACASAADHIQARLRDGDILAQAPLPRESLIAQALAGADPVALQALARRTVVLPAQTLVNANTSDLSVLQAVTPAVEPARLQALLGERDGGHWLLNRGDIANRLQLSNEQMAVLPLGIHSEWFLAVGRVQADGSAVEFRALLWREYRDDGARVQRVWTRIGA